MGVVGFEKQRPKTKFLRKDRAKPKKNLIQIMLICVDSIWIGSDEKSVVK